MNKDDLEKVVRIAGVIKDLSLAVARNDSGSRLQGYKKPFADYRKLLEPIILRYPKYELEFNAIPNEESISYSNMIPSLRIFSSFLDGIVKQETLESKQLFEQFRQEFFLDQNKPFSAHKIISDIMVQAVSSLKLVDNYLESVSLDFFSIVNSKVEVKILTLELKPNETAFKIATKKFIQEWGGSIFEVKKTNYFHDRYIIVDDSDVWHIGPSLNRLGIKPALITRISDQDIKTTIINLFNQQWTQATDA
jgi:hypothetical protein